MSKHSAAALSPPVHHVYAKLLIFLIFTIAVMSWTGDGKLAHQRCHNDQVREAVVDKIFFKLISIGSRIKRTDKMWWCACGSEERQLAAMVTDQHA